MKRILVSLAAAALLAVLVIAEPALSARPYQPDPVQFSMKAEGGPAKAARLGGPVTSRALTAPKRFNMVGLTWRGAVGEPTIRIRTRQKGERWSRWSPLDTHAEDGPDPGRERQANGVSAPSWVGEADQIQYRSSRRLPGAKLRFVNVRGTATATDRARNAVRRAASAAVLTATSAVGASTATAAGAKPSVVSRAGWGASKCKPRTGPDMGEVDAAVIHHTVNANDYSRSEAPDVVLGICLFHRNTNGWNDIGYNFLVDRFGTIYEGRAGGQDKAVIGAQAQGYNAQSTGIANLGTFTGTPQSSSALRSMARLIRWKLPVHGAPTSGSVTLTSTGGPSNRYASGRRVRLPRVMGHRDTGSTSCPGAALYAQLPTLRRLVGSASPDPGRALITAGLARGRKQIGFGSSGRVQGTLKRGDGAALAGQAVTLDARVGNRWRNLTIARTDATGRFAARVSVKRTRRVRARFGGATGVGAAGERFLLGVSPRITLSDTVSAAAAGGRVRVRGRISPRKARAYQVLQVRRAGRWRTVGVDTLRVTRAGRFSGSFVPAARSQYRYYVSTSRDARNSRGVSERVVLDVGRPGAGGLRTP